MALDKIFYTATATATGGRTGSAKSSDGALEVELSTPKEMGGPGGTGTNPEQLFAAGYSACFLGAIKAVAGKQWVTVPEDASITSKVSFGPITGGYNVQVDMGITLPGLERAQAESLVEAAHKVCPYSNATRGNVDVTLKVV